jgi:NAD-dependent DNA ligase
LTWTPKPNIMLISRQRDTMQIEPPKNCPSCGSSLEWVKDQLYCKDDSCPAKSNKQLEHFAKTLKIKGLGPSTIDKLDITSISDIYELPLDYLELQLKSEKLAVKLFSEIENSKKEPLNTVLPAFGIPLVGKTATDKLAKEVNSVWDINTETCKRAGLGPKVTENLMSWINNRLESFIHLPFSWEFSKETWPTSSNGVVCITGKLNSYPTKAAAKLVLESLGYTVKDSLTKEVTILVNESGQETAKTKKASDNGVRMIYNLKELMEIN